MHESPWRVTAHSEERVVKIPVSLKRKGRQVRVRKAPPLPSKEINNDDLRPDFLHNGSFLGSLIARQTLFGTCIAVWKYFIVKTRGSELILYLQVIIRDSPFPLYIPLDVFIGIDYNFDCFGTGMASLYHLQMKQSSVYLMHIYDSVIPLTETSWMYWPIGLLGMLKCFWEGSWL